MTSKARHNPSSPARAGCHATGEAKLRACCKGAIDAGLSVRGLEGDPVSGAVRILFGKPDEPGDSGNSWDEVLNAEDAKRAS